MKPKEFLVGVRFYHARNSADAVQGVIMEDHHLLVAGKMHIQFNTIAFGNGSLKSSHRILRNQAVCAVVASVGEMNIVKTKCTFLHRKPWADRKEV